MKLPSYPILSYPILSYLPHENVSNQYQAITHSPTFLIRHQSQLNTHVTARQGPPTPLGCYSKIWIKIKNHWWKGIWKCNLQNVVNFVGESQFSHSFLLNIVMPEHNRRHFADDIFKCISINDNFNIVFENSLKFATCCLIDTRHYWCG